MKFYKILLLLFIISCTTVIEPESITKPTTSYSAYDFGITGIGDETIKINKALEVIAVQGGTLDLLGLHITASLIIPPTPRYNNQVRSVRIINCMGSIASPTTSTPVLQAGTSDVYFFEIDHCLLIGSVNYSRFFNSRFKDTWVLPPPNEWGYTATGQSSYNIWDGGYIGGPFSLRAIASAGPASGPNSNSIRDTRIQGTVLLGQHVQNWSITDAKFESCGLVCLDLYGTRLIIRENRIEGAIDGIILRENSDGWIYPQYWSSVSGLRIKYSGADPLNWYIYPQPNQQ